NKQALPPLTEDLVLEWLDAHHARKGDWPHCRTGAISEAPGENWFAVDSALRAGGRGLPGGLSIAKLLEARRGVRNTNRPPPLNIPDILTWIDAFFVREGYYPNVHTGPIPEAPGETWQAVHDALLVGHRGLPGGSSLAKLLAKERGVRNIQDLPTLTIPKIQKWMVAHKRAKGEWPTRDAGPIPEAPGETWAGVYQAAYKGLRGLPGRTTVTPLRETIGGKWMVNC